MPPPNEEYVLDLLRDVGLLTRKQIEEARAELNGNTSVVELLVRQGLVSADDISRTVAAQAQMHWVDLADMVVPQDVIDEIKPQDARRFKMIPIARNEHGLVVATGDPLDFDSIDSLSFLLKREIELVCTTPEKIRQALIKYYGSAEEAVDVLREKIGDAAIEELDIAEGAELPEGEGGDAPIVRMVSMLLLEAHKLRRERYSSRAAREKFPGPLPDRRRPAGNAIAAEEIAVRHHQPAQDHDRLDEHRGKAPPAGRPHPGEDGQKIDRPARLDRPDQSRRKHGHAFARQNAACSSACPSSVS